MSVCVVFKETDKSVLTKLSLGRGKKLKMKSFMHLRKEKLELRRGSGDGETDEMAISLERRMLFVGFGRKGAQRKGKTWE